MLPYQSSSGFKDVLLTDFLIFIYHFLLRLGSFLLTDLLVFFHYFLFRFQRFFIIFRGWFFYITYSHFHTYWTFCPRRKVIVITLHVTRLRDIISYNLTCLFYKIIYIWLQIDLTSFNAITFTQKINNISLL